MATNINLMDYSQFSSDYIVSNFKIVVYFRPGKVTDFIFNAFLMIKFITSLTISSVKFDSLD